MFARHQIEELGVSVVDEDRKRDLRLQRARTEDGRREASLPFMPLGDHLWRPTQSDCASALARIALRSNVGGWVSGW